MTGGLLLALSGALLCGIGFAGMALSRHLLRRLMAFNILGSGVFLVLVAMARHAGGGPDPVAQALVLTGIVVAIAATALALVLIRRRYDLTGRVSLDDDPERPC